MKPAPADKGRKGSPLGQDRFDMGPSSHRVSWMVSYADMMTIILTFMILLLSISTIAQTKYDLLVSALTGEKTGNLQDVQEKVEKVINERQLGGEVRTQIDDDGLVIEFSNALLFESGQADLRKEAFEVFAPIETHIVHDLESRYGLIIEGYTDDVPMSSGRFRSNWELSTSRAIHVMERLVEAGMDRRRISVQGFADTRAARDTDLHDPRALKDLSAQELDDLRAANRRVIIRVYTLAPELAARLQELAGQRGRGGEQESQPHHKDQP